MEKIKIEDLSFRYAIGQKEALSHIVTEIEEGDFILLFGKSGSGKSTLLKQFKNEIRPYGDMQGTIFLDGKKIQEVDTSTKVGFVMQNIENQLVCDKVWHELAFGLENMNMPQDEMRIRVAETCYFFNLQDIFEKEISKLSGGQKEIVVLASVMMMRPDILILDEPLSKLDTTVREELLKYLKKIHEELGTTIIIAEHTIKELASMANKMIVMDDGKIEMQGKTEDVVKVMMMNQKHLTVLPYMMKLPTYFGEQKVIWHMGEARNFLKKHLTQKKELSRLIKECALPSIPVKKEQQTALSLKDIWFRYSREEKDVIKGLNLTVRKGEVYSLLAGNGSGKTTLLKIICGILKPYAGKLVTSENIVMLPQNPKTLFTHHTVKEELLSITTDERKIQEMVELFSLSSILASHPFDISGGEEERLGLAKIFLTDASIFLLDEPTKGIDACMKDVLKKVIQEKQKENKTILMVTHDMEFASSCSHRCGMLFAGEIIAENEVKPFFQSNEFYTTDFVRMTRNIDL